MIRNGLIRFTQNPLSICTRRCLRYNSTNTNNKSDINNLSGENNKENKVKKDDSNKPDPTGMFLKDRPDVPLNWRKMTNLEPWKRQMFALKEKFHDKGSWKPTKRISRNAMESLRYVKSLHPDISAGELAKHYQISPESVRRILKSNWKPTNNELQDQKERWKRRGEKIAESKGIPINKKPQEAKPELPEKPKKKKKKKKDIGDLMF